MKKAVVGIVQRISQAESLVSELHGIGVPSRDISVLLPSKSGTKDFAHEHNTKSPEGAVAGVGVRRSRGVRRRRRAHARSLPAQHGPARHLRLSDWSARRPLLPAG